MRDPDGQPFANATDVALRPVFLESDLGAQDTTAQQVTVTGSNAPPAADFSFTTDGPTADFSDASMDADGNGDITAWSWDFGDGNSSSAQNPSHTYDNGGTYDETLMVTDAEGAIDSITKQVTVSGGIAPPVANFSYPANDLMLDFTDASSDPDGNIVAWSWEFGDGNTSAAQNQSHTYAGPGTYDVVLTVTDNQGATDALGQQITVSDGSGGSEIFVSDLVGSNDDDGGNWIAYVTITVMDDAGNLVPNATVSGSWNKGFYATSSCMTDASGQCTVEQIGLPDKTRRVTFNITNVSHPTLTYNATLDVESSIRVNRP